MKYIAKEHIVNHSRIAFSTFEEGCEAMNWAKKIVAGLQESLEWAIEENNEAEIQRLIVRIDVWQNFVNETNDLLVYCAHRW